MSDNEAYLYLQIASTATVEQVMMKGLELEDHTFENEACPNVTAFVEWNGETPDTPELKVTVIKDCGTVTLEKAKALFESLSEKTFRSMDWVRNGDYVHIDRKNGFVECRDMHTMEVIE